MLPVTVPSVQIICRLHCSCIHQSTYTSLFDYCMFPQFLNVGSVGQLQKATGLHVVTLSDIGQGQESVYWPGVGVFAKRIRLALN